MKKFDLKAHNEKMISLSKRAANGTYPSKKTARVGSFIGTAIGICLAVAGSIGFVAGSPWGLGSLLAGIVTVISNILNLRRIHKAA